MQLNSVYLYPNKVDVFTNSLATWQKERYRRVYNRNLKIYRGCDNRVDLQVRNSDEKSQDISTRPYIVFNLINKETQELVLQKDCEIASASGGKAYVIITEIEMTAIETGYYHFSLHSETRTIVGNYHTVSARTPLYVDSQYGTFGIVEVGQHLMGEPLDSLRIDEFKEVIVSASATVITDKHYFSSIIDAKPNLTVPASVHTFQFNMSSYHGEIEVQASQDEGADPQVWATVSTTTADNDSILYGNVIGKYSWFRIKHTPDLTQNNPGSLDEILYR